MQQRLYNFSPGPAILPLEVVEKVRDNLVNYQESGLGLMEMSHRGPEFEDIIHSAEDLLRELLNIGEEYAIIFTTGGATTQFSMIPMNLARPDQTADYIITGVWAEKAFKEAQKFCKSHVAASSEDQKHSYIPEEFNFSSSPVYVHFTSNNTIYGTQFQNEPEVGKHALICDASSDLLHKKIDIKKYSLIYAGAQKNLGTSGVTIVILKKDLLSRSPSNLPIMMNYNTYAKERSLYNTPPTLPIYVLREVLIWIRQEGGLSAIEALNRKKANLLYEAIDKSSLYIGAAQPKWRSLMNVTFRLQNPSLEKKFLEEALTHGLHGLAGHRIVGGMRASIYNAFPLKGVETLVAFMKDFEARQDTRRQS